MLPKPKGWSSDYGAWFQDPGIVRAYPRRPPYPIEAIETLVELIADGPRVVLDIGCGTGDLARRLAPLMERVDAIDVSAGMIEQGKQQPGGTHPRLRWIHASIEEAPLQPPYALVTAGESLHWMEWDVALPRLADALSHNGMLAIVERNWDNPSVVAQQLRPIFARFGANRNFKPHDLVDEIELRGLYHPLGRKVTRPVPWWPTADEYVEMRHSQNGFSRDRMEPDHIVAFDTAVRQTLDNLVHEGVLAQVDDRFGFEVTASIVWGRPAARSSGVG